MKRASCKDIWRCLVKYGPAKPREIAKRLDYSYQSVYDGLRVLIAAGTAHRTTENHYSRRYVAIENVPTPPDMRGQSLGSRRALLQAVERRRKTPKTRFGDCALADCWKHAGVVNGAND